MANTMSDQRPNGTPIDPDERRRQLLAGRPVMERQGRGEALGGVLATNTRMTKEAS
jgi:hypothetical protein